MAESLTSAQTQLYKSCCLTVPFTEFFTDCEFIEKGVHSCKLKLPKKYNAEIAHAGQYNAGGSPLKDHHTIIHMKICILPLKCLTNILFLPPFSHQHRPGISSILMKTHKYEIFTGLFPWESPLLLTFTQFAMDYYHLFHQPSKNTHTSPTNKSVLWILSLFKCQSNVKF